MYRDTSHDPDPKDPDSKKKIGAKDPAELRPGPHATAPHPAPSKKEVAAEMSADEKKAAKTKEGR